MSGQPPACASVSASGPASAPAITTVRGPALQHAGQIVGLGGLVRLADASAALVQRTGCLFFGELVDRGGVGIDVVDDA